MPSANFVTGAIIAFWYGSNIGVLLLNKYLLSIYGFKHPVFLTLCHMLACTLTSYAVAASRLVPLAPIKSRQQFTKIAVLGVVFCFTVVLGNVSLRFIPVSFNQAIGATTPAFTAALSLLLSHQRETRATYLTLIPVVLGIIIASGAEPLFSLLGFLAAICATGARAFKSVLQGMMLSDASDRMDSMSLLAYMAPVAALALIPPALYYESDAVANAVKLGKDGSFWALLLLNSFMAYFVNLTNFLVTKHTSALTLQVLGNAKGVVATTISVLCFRNPVNVYSVLGYAITVTGVVLYSQAKKHAKKQQLIEDLKRAEDTEAGVMASDEAVPLKQQVQQLGFREDLGFRPDPRHHLAPTEAPPPLNQPSALSQGNDKLGQTAAGRIFVDATGRGLAPATQRVT